MVDWMDPQEILKDSDVFLKIIYVLFGAYVWELFTTWEFEWSLITRKRRFRLPLVLVFFFCRYCMLFSFIGLIIAYSVKTEINCNALFTFNSWTGNMAILCASTSLMIRTLALWERRLAIVIPLGALCLVHWGLLYRGMFIVHAAWSTQATACLVNSTQPQLLKINFFYTMAFDFVILCFTTIALWRHSARTGLWALLFKDGLVYFLVSFTTNSVPAILNIINLNPVMNVIATVPAATISTIAACRCVIRLMKFNGPEVYLQTNHAVSQAHGRVSMARPVKFTSTRPEVHVTTEAITVAEFPPSLAADQGIDDAKEWSLNRKSDQSSSKTSLALPPMKEGMDYRHHSFEDAV